MNKSLDNFFIVFKEEIENFKHDMDEGFSSVEKNLSAIESHVSFIESDTRQLQKISSRFANLIYNFIFFVLGVLIMLLLNFN